MKWAEPAHRRFARDLARAGFEVIEYRGRFGYCGPAVSCAKGNLQDVHRATKVRCVVDELGKGFVVYPDRWERVQAEKDKYRFKKNVRKAFGIELKSDEPSA